ncbi:outer membrane beta-barrel protein [Luteolibacter soli]|uniref:Outer membrane beta-barrel protein n=1 Tax=Luteolibacter soli TaxID=3135280 RepID=A0ABU9AUY9_9BACT
MKHSTSLAIALCLFSAAAAQAGEPAAAPTSYTQTASSPLYRWFVGGSAGYFFDNEEAYYTLHFGAKIAETGSVTHSLFVEGLYTQTESFGGIVESDVIPVTLNYKADFALNSKLSAYVGLGVGAGFVDSDAGVFDDSSVELAAQVFAGLGYNVTDNFEIYGGARWLWVDDSSIGPVSVKVGDDVGAELGLRFKF